MGNHSRFRVFDIIPNASWFSKLKSMSKRTSPKPNHCSIHHDHHPPPSSSSSSSTVSTFLSSSSSSSSSNKTGFHHHHRKSNYFNRDRIFNDPNAKQTSSPSIKTPTTTRFKSHLLPNSSSSSTRVSTGCSCRSSATVESCVSSKKQPPDSTYPNPAPESTASYSSYSSDVDSIVPDISCCSASSPMTSTLIGTNEALEGDGDLLSRSSSISFTDRHDYNNMQEKENHQNDKQPDSAFGEFRVAPIRIDSDRNRSPGKVEIASKTRLPSSFHQGGVKLRSNSPRLIGMSKRMRRNRRRKSLSESFAVVKASRDPGRDFKESMVEMIVENNIRGSRELEDLLACYLSLNSEHYHELIIAVFKQIWFDLIVPV